MEDIIHEKDNSRFVLKVDGKEAFLRYAQNGAETIEMITTYVPDDLRENGIGSRIAQHALDYAKENNLKVYPRCSFVRQYISNHEEYKSLVK